MRKQKSVFAKAKELENRQNPDRKNPESKKRYYWRRLSTLGYKNS
jgi:hypothetical protein